MKTATSGQHESRASARRETGIRLFEDQISKLDLLVRLSAGRRKRSQFISEAIDEFLVARLTRIGSTTPAI